MRQAARRRSVNHLAIPAAPLRRLAQFIRDRRGVSAVEFALLLPLMLSLYLGGFEVSQAVSISRKVTLVSRSVTDLIARDSDTSVSNTESSNALDAATAVVAPFSSSKLKTIVSQVKIDANGRATVDWSDARNPSARSAGQVVSLPAGLVIPNTWLIWGEASYDYKPVI